MLAMARPLPMRTMQQVCRGGNRAMAHANRVRKQLIADDEQPTIDPAIDEELRDYMARRKAESGVG